MVFAPKVSWPNFLIFLRILKNKELIESVIKKRKQS